MSTINTPNISLPTKAEKLETATPAPAKTRERNEPLHIKAQLINPAWAEEVVAAFSVSGPIAKPVAASISAAVAESVTKKFTRPKLARLIRKSLAGAIA